MGIAAQATVADVVAGLIILVARPLRPRHVVIVRAAPFAGDTYSGEVGEVTPAYTTLRAGTEEIRVPNSSTQTSVVTLRRQSLDAHLPVSLSLAAWSDVPTSDRSTSRTSALPAERTVRVRVARMDGINVQFSMTASVATEAERSTLEHALADALALLGTAG